MVPGGAGCLSQEGADEEELLAAVLGIEWVLFCSVARLWMYGTTPAADTTTVALWADTGADSWFDSGNEEDRRGDKYRDRNVMAENTAYTEETGDGTEMK